MIFFSVWHCMSVLVLPDVAAPFALLSANFQLNDFHNTHITLKMSAFTEDTTRKKLENYNNGPFIFCAVPDYANHAAQPLSKQMVASYFPCAIRNLCLNLG